MTSLTRRRSNLFLVLLAVLLLTSGIVTTLAQDEVPRNRTLIFENISERVTSPENYNPYLPSTLLHAGLQ